MGCRASMAHGRTFLLFLIQESKRFPVLGAVKRSTLSALLLRIRSKRHCIPEALQNENVKNQKTLAMERTKAPLLS